MDGRIAKGWYVDGGCAASEGGLLVVSEMVGWGENRGQVVVLVSGLMENSGLV